MVWEQRHQVKKFNFWSCFKSKFATRLIWFGTSSTSYVQQDQKPDYSSLDQWLKSQWQPWSQTNHNLCFQLKTKSNVTFVPEIEKRWWRTNFQIWWLGHYFLEFRFECSVYQISKVDASRLNSWLIRFRDLQGKHNQHEKRGALYFAGVLHQRIQRRSSILFSKRKRGRQSNPSSYDSRLRLLVWRPKSSDQT